MEAKETGPQHMTFVSGHVVRQSISRENNYGQAGDRYRAFSDCERNELISNLVGLLTPCDADVQQRMIEHLTACDAVYGRRVAEGLATTHGTMANGMSRRRMPRLPLVWADAVHRMCEASGGAMPAMSGRAMRQSPRAQPVRVRAIRRADWM